MQLTKTEIKKGLCAPTLIAIALGVLGVLGSTADKKAENLVSSIITIAVLWALCYYGHTTIAWVVLLAPLFVFLPVIALLVGIEIGARVNPDDK